LTKAYKTLIDPNLKAHYNAKLFNLDTNNNIYLEFDMIYQYNKLMELDRYVNNLNQSDIDQFKLTNMIMYYSSPIKLKLLKNKYNKELYKAYIDTIVSITDRVNFKYLQILISNIDIDNKDNKPLLLKFIKIKNNKSRKRLQSSISFIIILIISIFLCYFISTI
jgi:hypothetical protein